MRTRMVVMFMFSLMLNSLIVEAQNKKDGAIFTIEV